MSAQAQKSAKEEGMTYASDVTFTNSKGETLNFLNLKEKKISSVTFSYLEKEKVKQYANFLRFSFTTSYKPEEKVFELTSLKGIKVGYNPDTRVVNIYFAEKVAYDSLTDFSDASLNKRHHQGQGYPYQFSFKLKNIQSIDWE